MGSNICKTCAIDILKSYKFRLKYIESERKLLKMLDQSEQEPSQYESLLDVEVTVDESANALRTYLPSKTTDSRWKCNLCSASFVTRSQYYEHKRLHCKKAKYSSVVKKAEHSPTIKNVRQNRWKCDYCPVEFGTNKLKLKHEKDEHLDRISFHEPSILIEDDDSASEALVSSVKAEAIDNYQNDQYIDQEPEVDLGLYLIGKHSQMNSFDPLEINSLNDSLLIPMNSTNNSSETGSANDVNSKWKCRICTESFRTRDLLREHNQLHMALKRPKPEVKKVEKVKVEKVQVKPPKDESNPPKWQCKACMLIFDTRELLRIHRRSYVTKSETTGVRTMQCNADELVDHNASKKIKIEEIGGLSAS